MIAFLLGVAYGAIVVAAIVAFGAASTLGLIAGAACVFGLLVWLDSRED